MMMMMMMILPSLLSSLLSTCLPARGLPAFLFAYSSLITLFHSWLNYMLILGFLFMQRAAMTKGSI